MALLNDCKYGYDVRGHTLRLSLLRAPTAPDPRCDRGRHRFTYALLPHAGDLTPVMAAGYALGAGLAVRVPAAAGAGPSSPAGDPAPTRPLEHSLVRVSGPGFVVETVKAADDGRGVIVRGYEALGGRRSVRLWPGVPCTAAVRTDLLERDDDAVEIDPNGDGITLTVRPFEIVTLRLLP